MSDPYGQERAAVFAAIDALGGVQERISSATESAEMAAGAVQACSGASTVESATNAAAAVQQVRGLLEEAFTISQSAVEELMRFGRGF